MPMHTRTVEKPFKYDCCELCFQKVHNMMSIHAGAIKDSCSDTLNLFVVEIYVYLWLINKKLLHIVHNAYWMYHQKVDVAIFVIVQQIM